MNYFKYPVGANSEPWMVEMRDELGSDALNYWVLVELCAQKILTQKCKKISEADCHFVFHLRVLRENFRLGAAKTKAILNLAATKNLFSVEISGNKVEIFMPNLAKSLDRDWIYTRNQRVTNALVTRTEEEEEEEKEKKEEEAAAAFLKKEKARAPTLRVVGRQSAPAPALSSAALEAEILNVVAIGATLESAFVQIGGAKPPPSVLQLAPRIYEHYGDPEDFAAWLEAKCNSDAVRKARDPAQYLIRVLALEFGVTQ